MIQEGVGRVAPARITIRFSRGDFYLIAQDANQRATFRRYSSRSDAWGRGLASGGGNGDVPPLRGGAYPIFVGMLGEEAIARHIRQRLGHAAVSRDSRLAPFGDFGVDLLPFGLTIQVKTRQNPSLPNLIKRQEPSGRRVKMPAEVCTFAEWIGGFDVSLLGWIWTFKMLRRPVVNARKGDHLNIEVGDSDLLPMSRLIDELECRRGGIVG